MTHENKKSTSKEFIPSRSIVTNAAFIIVELLKSTKLMDFYYISTVIADTIGIDYLLQIIFKLYENANTYELIQYSSIAQIVIDAIYPLNIQKTSTSPLIFTSNSDTFFKIETKILEAYDILPVISKISIKTPIVETSVSKQNATATNAKQPPSNIKRTKIYLDLLFLNKNEPNDVISNNGISNNGISNNEISNNEISNNGYKNKSNESIQICTKNTNSCKNDFNTSGSKEGHLKKNVVVVKNKIPKMSLKKKISNKHNIKIPIINLNIDSLCDDHLDTAPSPIADKYIVNSPYGSDIGSPSKSVSASPNKHNIDIVDDTNNSNLCTENITNEQNLLSKHNLLRFQVDIDRIQLTKSFLKT